VKDTCYESSLRSGVTGNDASSPGQQQQDTEVGLLGDIPCEMMPRQLVLAVLRQVPLLGSLYVALESRRKEQEIPDIAHKSVNVL
jgi:hypothetical protein